MNDATVPGTVRGTVPGTVSVHRDATPAPTTTPSTTPFTSSLSAAQGGRRAEEASLTARIRAIPETDALTRLVATIRPAWDIPTIRRAIERDDRPWTTVVEAFWRGANDPDIAHPNGLRYVGATYDQAVPKLPTVDEALAANDDTNLCDHGSRVGACPMCRRGAA